MISGVYLLWAIMWAFGCGIVVGAVYGAWSQARFMNSRRVPRVANPEERASTAGLSYAPPPVPPTDLHEGWRR